MSAFAYVVRGSSWFERFIFVWTVANTLIQAIQHNWGHASTYLLAAALTFALTVNRQAADRHSYEWTSSCLCGASFQLEGNFPENVASSALTRWKEVHDATCPVVQRLTRDAGHTTVGHALGVALVLGAFLALLALAGAVETGGAW